VVGFVYQGSGDTFVSCTIPLPSLTVSTGLPHLEDLCLILPPSLPNSLFLCLCCSLLWQYSLPPSSLCHHCIQYMVSLSH